VAPISFNFFITFGSKWLSPDLKDSFFYKRFADEESTAKKEIGRGNLAETSETIQDQPQGKSIFRFSVDFLLVPGKILPIPHISINVEGESNKHLPDAPQSPETLESPETPEAPQSLETPQSPDETPSGSMVKPWITLKHYISFVIWLTLVFGLAFQMPLVVFMLGQLGLVGLDTLKSTRKYVLFAIIIASAVITPPDVISQIMLSIPMYALYEVGIILVQLWPKRK
ncbi:MAG: twin-arginine translocase subunit TatC, partial [Sedimentisphaerales bacterium]|nr:twin-arginine translocase subunit TatC [Sedimentisphaerales bacterium]